MKRPLYLIPTGFAQTFGVVTGLALSALPATLLACPICSTETGQQVRAGIFDENFWGTLVAVVSPFPVLLLGIAAYHFGLPKKWDSRHRTQILSSPGPHTSTAP
jgi:hypothetical protein